MQNIKDFIVTVKDGFELDIPVNTKFNGLDIANITMFVAAEAEDDFYADGDLALITA